MKIILHPSTIDEVGIEYADDGIKLCFRTPGRDIIHVVLDDLTLGHIIEHLIYYAWGTTIEEMFKDTDDTKNNTSSDILDDITF